MKAHLSSRKCTVKRFAYFLVNPASFLLVVLCGDTWTGSGKWSNSSENSFEITKKGNSYGDTIVFAQTFYSGKQLITCFQVNDSTFYLRDFSKGKGIVTLRSDVEVDKDYISKTPNWFYKENDQFALDVHYGVSQTYLFYKSLFGRNSIDDNGYALYSYVNDRGIPNNAIWDGKVLRIGNHIVSGRGVAALDIIGHELTHGLTSFTSRLHSGGESGAINESISDIMGKSIEFWSGQGDLNWTISSKMNYNVRDMSNPRAFNQPDTYKDPAYWYKGSSSEKNDHINSGVGNYMFFLLVKGGQGKNANGKLYKVTKIGLGAADSIIYRTETVYLQSYSQYCDWREACIKSAIDLFGSGSTQLQSVKDAWDAVGVPSCEAIYKTR